MKKAIACLLSLTMIAANFMAVLPASAETATQITPGDISGLKAWYDSQDLKLADGAKVAKWENKAGDSAYDAVQTDVSKQPVFASNAGGKPEVKLTDGTFLKLSEQFDLNDMSIFAVTEFDSIEGGADDNQIFSKLQSTDPWGHNWYFNVSNKKFNFGWKDSETWRDYNGGNNGLVSGKSYVLSGVKAADRGSIYINGEKLGEINGSASSPAAVHNSDPIYIGGAGNGKSMDGAVREIIAFDRGLDSDETDAVNKYLADKWDVHEVNLTNGEIKIDGEPIPAFSASTLSYKHTLKKGTEKPPVVTASFDGAKVTVVQAESTSETAYVKVVKDGVETTYSVKFSVLEREVMDLKQPEISQVKITSDYWKEKLEGFADITVNDVFDKFEANGTLENFKNVGTEGGAVSGNTDPWNDGLLYETIRGASDFLITKKNKALEERIDGYIDIIYNASMKSENGYLSTWAMIQQEGKYFDETENAIWYHDAYNFGCMAEAAVHYYKATGKVKLLYVVSRFAEFITDNYGYGLKPDGTPKINMVPSHEGPEEMLLELYKLYKGDSGSLKTAVERYNSDDVLDIDENDYANLVKFWIENRGNYDNRAGGANYGVYAQDHDRYYNQQKGQGHAVRANLFYNGLAAAGTEFRNYTYLSTAETIWNNIVTRQMYVTGGVGATAKDEAYAEDYELPNDGYCETCAQVAMGFFSENMSLAFGESKYADSVEKYIYNGVLGCIGENGTSYYYQQPLDNKNNSRWDWNNHTPCCPPMFLKFYSQLPAMIYSYNDDSVYVNQFISSQVTLDDGTVVSQTSDLPWKGETSVTMRGGKRDLHIRIPDWMENDGVTIKVNGEDRDYSIVDGYAVIDAKDGEIVSVSFDISAARVYADERVEADRGKVALQYGPIVYCFEKADNSSIVNFDRNSGNIALRPDEKITAEYDKDLLKGVVKLKAKGEYYDENGEKQTANITAIPFYVRSNRGQDTSYVWINEEAKKPEAVSRHWLAKAQNTTRDLGNSAAAAFDGSTATYWSAGSSSLSLSPKALIVDLGGQKDIEKIAVTFKKSFEWDYSVLISNDLDGWSEYSRSKPGKSALVFNDSKKAKGRYLALKINNAPSGEYAAVSEFAVYSPGNSENIAKGKLCSASSTLNAGDSVFAMIDGSTDTRYCPTGEQKPQTLDFDLGEIAEVTGMEILFEKPSDWSYTISVSKDGNNYSVYNRDTYHMTEDKTVLKLTKSARARYVRLSVTGTTGGVWASVWEFNVKTQRPLKDIYSDILGRSVTASAPREKQKIGSEGKLTAGVKNADSCQWQIDKNDSNGFVDISGANKAELTQRITRETALYKYRIITYTGETAAFSNSVRFSVYDKAERVAVYQTSPGSLQLKATVSPGTACLAVKWSSSDSKIAQVSSSGRVKFLKDGKVTITAENYDGTKGAITLKNGWIRENGKDRAYRANKKLTRTLVVSGSKTYCVDKSGSKVKNGIYTVGGKTYAFDSKGVKVNGTKVKKLGKYRYLIKSGSVVKNKVLRVGKKTYAADKKGRVLFGNKVVKVSGRLYYVGKTGYVAKKQWKKYKKNNYYASKTGRLYANTVKKIGGKKYKFTSKGICKNK